MKSRLTSMPESQVVALVEALASAGVRCWVAGGWGVDALLGRQTRRHDDLDIVVGDDPDDIVRAGRVLAGAGFRPAIRQFNPGLRMPLRHVWHDDTGCTVEILPVALGEPPFNGPRPRESAAEARFTRGSIGGRAVPCLSARLQFALHEGYATRPVDTVDMHALRTHVKRMEETQPR